MSEKSTLCNILSGIQSKIGDIQLLLDSAVTVCTAPEPPTPLPEGPYDAKVLGTPDLLSYWPFLEGSGTTVLDSTLNGHDLTMDAVGWDAGLIGDYALASSPAAFGRRVVSPLVDGASEFSIELWFNAPVAEGGRHYLVSVPEGGSVNGTDIALNGTEVEFRVNASGGVKVASGFFTAGQSTHVVLTYDGAFVTGYVNGIMGSQVAQSGGVNASLNEVILGRFSTFWPGIFNGTIDKVALYGRALSAPEIVDHSTG